MPIAPNTACAIPAAMPAAWPVRTLAAASARGCRIVARLTPGAYAAATSAAAEFLRQHRELLRDRLKLRDRPAELRALVRVRRHQSQRAPNRAGHLRAAHERPVAPHDVRRESTELGERNGLQIRRDDVVARLVGGVASRRDRKSGRRDQRQAGFPAGVDNRHRVLCGRRPRHARGSAVDVPRAPSRCVACQPSPARCGTTVTMPLGSEIATWSSSHEAKIASGNGTGASAEPAAATMGYARRPTSTIPIARGVEPRILGRVEDAPQLLGPFAAVGCFEHRGGYLGLEQRARAVAQHRLQLGSSFR